MKERCLTGKQNRKIGRERALWKKVSCLHRQPAEHRRKTKPSSLDWHYEYKSEKKSAAFPDSYKYRKAAEKSEGIIAVGVSLRSRSDRRPRSVFSPPAQFLWVSCRWGCAALGL